MEENRCNYIVHPRTKQKQEQEQARHFGMFESVCSVVSFRDSQTFEIMKLEPRTLTNSHSHPHKTKKPLLLHGKWNFPSNFSATLLCPVPTQVGHKLVLFSLCPFLLSLYKPKKNQLYNLIATKKHIKQC